MGVCGNREHDSLNDYACAECLDELHEMACQLVRALWDVPLHAEAKHSVLKMNDLVCAMPEPSTTEEGEKT